MTSELKVGMLFLVVLALVVTFTVFVTPDLHKKGDYQVQFPRVQRLKSGDPVTYNGVRVGSVSTVEPVLRADGSPAVAVVFAIEAQRRKAVLVDKDTRYTIRQGVLGGSELEILAAKGSPITPEATQAATGVEPVGFDEALASVRALVEENRVEIQKTIRTVRTAMESFGLTADELRAAVAENREQIKTTIRNIGDAAGTINATVAENRSQIGAAIANFRETATHISEAAERIGAVVAENREEVKRLIERFSIAGLEVGGAAKEIREAVAENRPALKDVIDNTKTISEQIAAGKGSIGKLVMEDTAHDKLEGVLDSAQQRLEEIKPVTQGLSELRFIGSVAGGADLRSEVTVGEIGLRIEPRPWKFYEVGIVSRSAGKERDVRNDDPDKLNVDFNLQLGWRFLRDDDEQRYLVGASAGLLESRVGGKAWWNIAESLTLMGSIRQAQNTRETNDRRYEPGDVMARVTLDWILWHRITLSAGVNDLGYKPGPWVGIRGELLDNDLRNLFSASSFVR